MKRSEGDVYVIKNAGENSVLTVTGTLLLYWWLR